LHIYFSCVRILSRVWDTKGDTGILLENSSNEYLQFVKYFYLRIITTFSSLKVEE